MIEKLNELVEITIRLDDEIMQEVRDFLKSHPELGYRDELHFINCAMKIRAFDFCRHPVNGEQHL